MTLTFDEFLESRRYATNAAHGARKYTKIIFDAGYSEEDIKRIDGDMFRKLLYLGGKQRNNPFSNAIGKYRSYMRERDGKE